MLGGTFLLTKLLLPSLLEAGPDTGKSGDRDVWGGSRVVNVSSGGMYTVSADGVAADLNSDKIRPYDGALM